MTPAASSGWRDISLPIGPDSIAWSGLPAPRLSFVARIDEGSSVNVGQMDCSLHTGTHADAPLHVSRDGAPAEMLDPAAFIGLAEVVRLESTDAITVNELQSIGLERRRPERVLLATPNQYDGRRFPATSPHITPEAAELLVSLGVRLVGVNTPSVDPLDSKTLPAHHVLFGGGAVILENLRLDAVEPGPYELCAPPLLVVGGDAAPVRALVRRSDRHGVSVR